VSSSHHDDVDVPEGLLASDHDHVRHHWWGKYVHTLSEYAESYSKHEGWGNNVLIRKTGERAWEPMPLVRVSFHLSLSLLTFSSSTRTLVA